MKISEHLSLSDGTIGELVNFTGANLPDIIAVEQLANPYPWSQKNFYDSVISSHICVGVQVRTNWIAHAVFSRAAGEAELLILVVHPEWRGKGVAKGILETMARKLAAFSDTLFLEVRESNSIAIHLYESLGFNCVGTRPNYYPMKDKYPLIDRHHHRKESALIYALSLNISDNLS